MSPIPDIRRGRLTSDERTEIGELAARGFTSGRIALKLNRHPATINWAMTRLGLREPTLRRTVVSYRRNGVEVRPFSETEDAVLTALRVAGLTTTRIAEELTQQFGHPRSPHTINMRLTLLANVSDAA